MSTTMTWFLCGIQERARCAESYQGISSPGAIIEDEYIKHFLLVPDLFVDHNKRNLNFYLQVNNKNAASTNSKGYSP